jgi:hypothetical protein
MSYLRFNQVFFALMAIAFLSAFVLPLRITERTKGQVQDIFAPVAWPASHLVGWTLDRIVPAQLRDDGSPKGPRPNLEVYAENERLRIQVANLTGQVQRLQEREAERATLGDVRDMCTRLSVFGTDSGPRQTLLLDASSFDGLREGMPVLYTGGIVGRISRVGVGGAQVLLLTDRQSTLTAVFARFVQQPNSGVPDFQRLAGDPVLVKGAGNGTMFIENVAKKTVDEVGIRLQDWLILSDRDWPLALDRYRIGFVADIVPSRSPGFVDIRVSPDQNLLKLRDVMVMNKEKG